MGNTTSLYGSIGYTYLINETLEKNNYPKYILVLSDNHSKLPYCNNYKMISDWLKEKINTNNILLEEVPRDNSQKLKDIFINSDHTQKLKKFFINNSNLILGIDIRPLLIKFSWELLELTEMPKLTLNQYLEDIDEFFYFNNHKIKNINKNYEKGNIINSPCYIQFEVIKKIYLNYRKKNINHLNQLLSYIYDNHKIILEDLNNILDNIMEFYVILNIFKPQIDSKNIIIHTGLVHSEKIIYWLNNYYSYKIIEEKGINKIEENEIKAIKNGCLELSKTIDNKF